MASPPPQVQVYYCNEINRSYGVPPSECATYQNLIEFARRKYGALYRKPEESFDVHFHYSSLHIIGEQECNRELDDVSYDRGAYFTKPYKQGQTVRLFAHFMPKTNPTSQEEQATRPAKRIKLEVPAKSDDPRTGSDVSSAINIEDTPTLQIPQGAQQRDHPLAVDDRVEGGTPAPALHKQGVVDAEHRTPQRPEVGHQRERSSGGHGASPRSSQDVSHPGQSPRVIPQLQTPVSDRAQSEGRMSLSLSALDHSNRRVRQNQASRSSRSQARASRRAARMAAAVGYAPLSPDATAQRHATDFDVAEKDFMSFHSGTRGRRAHATLIDGSLFGVDALHPCEACVKNDEPCRIYHPDMRHRKRHRAMPANRSRIILGVRCSSCRWRLIASCNAH